MTSLSLRHVLESKHIHIFDIARPIAVLRNSLFSKHTEKDQDSGKSGQGELSSPHRSWLEAPGREQSVNTSDPDRLPCISAALG